jgi:tetratricopeptide (TPR) repeat protein
VFARLAAKDDTNFDVVLASPRDYLARRTRMREIARLSFDLDEEASMDESTDQDPYVRASEVAAEVIKALQADVELVLGGGSDAQKRLAGGRIYEYANRNMDAAQMYAGADGSEASAVEAHARLAIVHLKSSAPKKALQTVIPLARDNPKFTFRSLSGNMTSLHTILGDCYAYLGERALAISSYRAALELNGDDLRAGSQIVQMEVERGDLAAARKLASDVQIESSRHGLKALLRMTENDPSLLPQIADLKFNIAGSASSAA